MISCMLHTGLKDRISTNHLSVRPCVGRRLSKNVWGKSGSVQCSSTPPPLGEVWKCSMLIHSITTTHRLHCLKMVSKRLTLFKVDWSGGMGRNCGKNSNMIWPMKIPIQSDQWKFQYNHGMCDKIPLGSDRLYFRCCCFLLQVTINFTIIAKTIKIKRIAGCVNKPTWPPITHK